MTWLHETLAACRTYRTGVIYLGGVLVGLGFCLVFGGTLLDCLWAGLMGLIIGLVTRFMDKQEANPFSVPCWPPAAWRFRPISPRDWG